ncbi:MAG: pantoate--beta-alanine ligase, partial [Bdellovibrionales bacterium]|nr:pantoate--beta-alanine ligase [Bdellovibrionales bacterium]
GLALSSRNVRLNPREREKAPLIYRILTTAPSRREALRKLAEAGFRVEYLDQFEDRLLVAAHLGSVRLIDNVSLDQSLMVDSLRERPKILITSGPTREPIDRVRQLTNGSSGKTGAELAKVFVHLGYNVYFVHAQGSEQPNFQSENLKLFDYTDFESLNECLKTHLKNESFFAIIHAAAVSDFSVDAIEGAELRGGKLSSGATTTLHLKPRFKILSLLQSYSKNPDLKVIGFKLTADADINTIESALLKVNEEAHPLAIVHNDLREINSDSHKGQIFSHGQLQANFNTKGEMAWEIYKILEGITL